MSGAAPGMLGREVIIRLYEQGEPMWRIAEFLGFKQNYVRNVVLRYEEAPIIGMGLALFFSAGGGS